jgi:nucleoside-diphosphate-sugar epimerase
MAQQRTQYADPTKSTPPKLPATAFITGANGFIGRALFQYLQAAGIAVRGMDLMADPARNVVAGDIAAQGDWQRHVSGCELFIHTAAVVSNTAPALDYQRISIGGTRHALDAAIRGGSSRFVQLSSIAAYGLDFTTERDETAPISTLSGYPYCDAKAASEHPVLAAHAAGEIACTLIRPGDVYGPGSRPWILMPLDLIRRRQFLLPNGGKGIFSPVYIDNLLSGITLAATHSAAPGQIFNITDGTGVSCAHFFSFHYRWLGKRTPPPSLPTPLAAAVVSAGERLYRHVLRQPTEMSLASLAMLNRQSSYSIEKARRLLDYRPTVDLESGMDKTWNSLRAAKPL